jgi:hypothetical protein
MYAEYAAHPDAPPVAAAAVLPVAAAAPDVAAAAAPDVAAAAPPDVAAAEPADVDDVEEQAARSAPAARIDPVASVRRLRTDEDMVSVPPAR